MSFNWEINDTIELKGTISTVHIGTKLRTKLTKTRQIVAHFSWNEYEPCRRFSQRVIKDAIK